MGPRRALAVVIFGLLTALPVRSQGPAYLVRDLSTLDATPAFNPSAESEGVGGVFYFVLDDGIHGEELWSSDGTAAGTQILRDICPGSCSSHPRTLTASGGLLFFVADGANGPELWRSDGTPAGTLKVADLYPGLQGFVQFFLLDAGGKLFFSAQDPVHGMELWVTDGTAAGTSLVRDVNPGAGSSSPRLLAASSGLVLFAADDGVHGYEPWVSDGTAAGTRMLADVSPGSAGSLALLAPEKGPDATAAPWGGFVFVADDGTHGPEPWKSDGTPAGTSLLKDVAAGGAGSSPYGLTAANGRVVFTADDLLHGRTVWGTDGTEAGTVLLHSGDLSPLELTAVGSRVFFRGTDSTHGAELWATDGTPAGTALVKNISPGAESAFPDSGARYGLSAVGGQLLFVAYQGSFPALWRSDGTAAGTQPVLPPPGGWPYPQSTYMTDGYGVAGGRLFFRAGAEGQIIWATDGTGAGVGQVAQVASPASSFLLYDGKLQFPGSMAGSGGTLFFQANGQLWQSDGTAAGTRQVQDLGPDPIYIDPYLLRAANGRVVFNTLGGGFWASDGTSAGTAQILSSAVVDDVTLGSQVYFLAAPYDGSNGLWKTDGTAAGTALVSPIASADDVLSPALMATSGGKIFYRSALGGDVELGVSDGTAAGTFRFDLLPGPASSLPESLTDAGGTLFFSASQPGSGRELWKSDGTAAGTVMVKDINPGSASSISTAPSDTFAPLPGGVVLFAADDGTSGLELWRSDGTAAGTTQVLDIQPGPTGSALHHLTAAGGQVYFVADDGVHGQELWVSDGTAAGTHLVQDIAPGPGSSFPDNLTAVGSVLVFSAFDEAHGVEAWRSDGTLLGTRRLQDIAPGPLSSSPTAFTPAGDKLFFVANDNVTGFELWAVPQASVLGTFSDIPPGYWAWRFVEALARSGITGGCGDGQFCPSSYVSRAQMAVFVLTARGTAPAPAKGALFGDVPAGYWAGPWIEELAREGVAGGCSANPPLYCPDHNLTRAEMAVLLTLARGENPPPATGTRFGDVPADYWAARFIEQLAADGITGGCGNGNYCPEQPITRSEVAVFLATAFHLPLP